MIKKKRHTSKKTWWSPIVHFLVHTVVGTSIFIIIATPAVVLSLAVKWLASIGVDGYTLTVLSFLEHAILTIDGGLFLVFLIGVIVVAIKEFLK